MAHSKRYEKRRKLAVMYNSNRRLYNYSEALREEAVYDGNQEIADMLATVMVKCLDIQRELTSLSKSLCGYPLGMVVTPHAWSTLER